MGLFGAGKDFIGGQVDQLKGILGARSDLASGGKLFNPYLAGPISRKVQDLNPPLFPLGNWNQNFRYSFEIAKADASGAVVSGTNDNAVPDGFNDLTKVFLRLPPQAISITTQFANNVSATNHGIYEEHNGVVFRTITISGTTGLYPDRAVINNSKNLKGPLGLVRSIFPGVETAITNVIKQVKSTINSVVNIDGDPSFSPEKGNLTQLQGTGYYQFWLLHNFLVAYAEMKKRKTKNNDAGQYRLLFNSPKDNISYVVTPITFELRRDKSEPMLYRYSIMLKAWDIAQRSFSNEDKAIDVLSGVPTPDNVGALRAVTEVLRQSRRTISAVNNVFQAAYSDFNNVFNTYNQAMLVVKDASGVPQELADFKTKIKQSAAVLLRGQNNDFISSVQSYQATSETKTTILPFSSADETEGTLPGSGQQNSINGAGGSSSQTSNSPQGETTPDAGNANLTQATSALQSALDDPDFAAQPLDQFFIPEEVQTDIDETTQSAIDNTSANDVRDLIDGLKQTSNNYAESVGMADADYNRTYRLSSPITVDRTPTEDDIINQAALEEARLNWISTLATGQIFQEREGDPFVFANLALQDTDKMPSPVSAIPVVFRRGFSLEEIAEEFLDDANRAREIAVLNNLRPPYIDEAGFQVNVFNANGRQFVVNSNDNLSINQQVTIKGTTVAQTKRRIINIEDIGGGQFRITVDGPDNLAIYTSVTNPYIWTRMPGTVGGGDIILIPSQATPDDPLPLRPSALNDRLTHAEKVFKIDLKLDEKGRDLLVSHTGDVSLAYGYDNALQALRLAVETERGELEQHKDYGLAVPIGGRTSDLTESDVKEAVATTILNDRRFADAITAVDIEGSVSRISINAFGAAGTGQIPVQFEVGKE